MFLGLRSIIYPAPDLAAAKEWWRGVLGFDPYFDQPFYVGFAVGGFELGLLPDGSSDEGPVTYWGVDDIEAAYASLIEKGATSHHEISDVGEGIKTASVKEPTVGSIVGLIYNPHFKG